MTAMSRAPAFDQTDNAILDRWQAGQSGGKISADLKLTRNRVTKIVCAARRRGDVRAIHHLWPDGHLIGRYRHRPPAVAV